MKIPDLVNSTFEFGGSLAVLVSILDVIHSQQVHGVSWVTVMFFTIWGYWNIYYYFHLGQMFSWTAGILVTLANTSWVILLMYYSGT